MPVTRFEDLDLSKQYTYADYLTWEFSERVELFNGWVAKMSRAPTSYHQKVSGELYYHFRKHLGRGPCQMFPAPFDVRLMSKAGVDTVVQPDLCVICDETKIDRRGCNGAPDFVVEILSPGNSKRELRDKFGLYEEAGVKEYWVVDPQRRSVERYVLKDGAFVGLAPRTDEDRAIGSTALEGFIIDGADVFP